MLLLIWLGVTFCMHTCLCLGRYILRTQKEIVALWWTVSVMGLWHSICLLLTDKFILFRQNMF